jgi:hypothetical protein
MEEMPVPSRINSEGGGMSAATSENDMKTRHIFSVVAVAAVLTLTSPAYAGRLGGAGSFGGNLAGNSSGIGGRGGFGGSLHGSPDSFSKPLAKTPKKVDGQATAGAGKSAATAAASAKPSTSANAAAAADQSLSAGTHTVSAGTEGSLGAQPSGVSASSGATAGSSSN